MKYIGQFRDLNEKLYEIDITTKGDSSATVNVVLGNSPIVTTWENDDHLFKAVKYSSATVTIIANDYLMDIYSNQSQDTKVELFGVGTGNSKTLFWTGYATPNLYNQEWEGDVFELEIEAIDALSTLQYIDYSPINTEPSIQPITAIIKNVLKKCNAYTSYYVSQLYNVNNTEESCFWEQVYISEKNFFDEDGEAMKCDEVLEEICKYMNMTAVAHTTSVYFLDYTNNTKYYKYNLNDSNSLAVTKSEEITINSNTYAINGQQLSLGKTYNKVTVKDNLFTYDHLMPSLFDDDVIENYNGKNNIIKEELYFSNHASGVVEQEFNCYFKYYSNPNYKFFYYSKDAPLTEIYPTIHNYDTTVNTVGATLVKHYPFEVKDYSEKPESLDFKNYLLLHVHNTQDGKLRPMFTYTANTTLPQFFLGEKSYLIIKGNFLYMDRPDVMWIMERYHNNHDYFDAANLYIWCKLKCGNQYWDGEKWVGTDTNFKLYFEKNNNHLINHAFPLKNNITYDMGLDGEKGLAIPMPSEGNSMYSTAPIFTMYQPQKVENSYRMDAIWLSDFDILTKTSNLKTDEEFNSDTEYSNVINENYVNEFSDATFKICTWDNKQCNYSSPCYRKHGNSLYKFVDKTYNTQTKESMRMEEHYINKIINEYTNAPIILEITTKELYTPFTVLKSKFFVNKFNIDTQSYDWRNNENNIKLVERK